MSGLRNPAKVMLAPLFVLAIAVPAFSQTSATSTWNGGTGSWTVPLFWATNGQPASVYPDNTATTVYNVTIDSGQQDFVMLTGAPAITINSLTLSGNPNFSSTLAIGENGGAPGTLTIGSNTTPASLVVNSLGNLFVNANSELLLNIASGNGTVTNNGDINVGSASVTVSSLLINDAGNTHQLTLSGPGTLTLQPGSVIQGVKGDETLINDSAIQGGGTISNLVLTNNGTIIANGTNALNIDPSVSGFLNNGTLQVNSGSTLNLSGLSVSTNSATVTVTGTLNVTSGSTLLFGIAPGNATVTNNGFIDLSSASGTGSGLFLADGGNAHQLTLSGTGTLTLQPGSVIQGISGDEELINESTIQGAGLISKLGVFNTGTIIANETSPLIIDANTNQNDQGFQNSTFVQVDAGSTLDIDASAATTAGNQIFNSRTITVNGGGTLEFSASAGQSVKILNSLGSPAAIDIGGSGSGGTLKLDGSNATFDLYGSGGLLTLSNNADNLITGVTGTETFINDTGQTLSGAGNIENLALVNKGTIIANGTHALGIAPNADGFTNSGTVQVNTGSTLAITKGTYVQTAGSTDVDGTLMSPSITITGGTLVSGGGIVETTKLTSGVLISADSTGFTGVGSGTFSATHGYQELANGTLDELISSKSAFGVIDVTGPASLNGTLDVTFEKGFVPTVGEQFALLDFTPGDLTGTFADFPDATFDNGAEKWLVDYNDAEGDVILTAEATSVLTTPPPTTTPEPPSLLLIGTGLLGIAFVLRKRIALSARR